MGELETKYVTTLCKDQIKLILQGELQHICNKCVHDFIKIGTRQTLFGLEEIYQCNKCGYQTGKFEEKN